MPSAAYPSLVETHHLQSFWKKCVSWKPLPSLSTYARFCPMMMMMKSFPLWKKHSSLGNGVSGGESGFLTWGTSTSGNAWSRRQVPLAAAAGSTQGWTSLSPCTWWWVKERVLWGGQCQLSPALSKEAATCSKPCSRAQQLEQDNIYAIFPKALQKQW